MKKLLKIALSFLGACNNVMSIFIPIAVALLWVAATATTGWKANTLLIIALASTLFRGIKACLE
tara:strand:+ start:27 stop:218 length:192 start_codon:yes stop_codon:yes gene_type:complete